MDLYEKTTSQPKGKESDDHRLWRARIDRAIRKRKPHARKWKSYSDYLSMKDYDVEDPGINEVAINKCRAFVNSRLAGLAFKAPRATFRPRPGSPSDSVQMPDGSTVEKFKVTEHLVNYLTSQPRFGLDRTLRRFAKAGLMNMGVVHIGYEAEYEDGHETKELYAYDEATEEFLTDPATGEPIEVQSAEYGKPYPKEPTEERWFVENIPAWRMLIDPDGENEFYDHTWVGCEYCIPLEEAKKSRIFKKSVTKDLTSTVKSRAYDDDPYADLDDNEELDPDVKSDVEFVRIFRIHDIKEKKIYYLADGCGDFLAKQDYPIGLDHSPYVFFRLDEEDEEFYPRPPICDAIPIAQQLDTLGELDLTMRRQNIPKRVYEEGTIDDDQVDILNSPVPNEMAKCRAGRNPQGIIAMAPTASMQMDSISMRQMLERSFDEITGQTAMDRGAQGADLATEVQAMTNAQRIRTDDYRSILFASVREIVKKLTDSVQANMTTKQAVSLDVNGQAFTAEITYDMITADVECEIDVEDMLPRSTDMEVAQLEHVMATIGQYPWLATKPALINGWLDKIRINDTRIRDELVAAANEAMAAQNGQNNPDMMGNMPQDPTMMMRQQGGANAV